MPEKKVIMPRQEDISQKVVGSNRGAGKRCFLSWSIKNHLDASQVTGDEKVRRDLEKNGCLLKNLIKLIFPIFHPKVIF